ncbi:MAG: hypothetical protein JST34_03295 [Bacteroidetes bacterium]|nr:hypothetical protein [Bacteroidota bacterium]
MQLIQNNPYRTLGLLVGVTAREQDRQIRRLKQFIEAEQNPQDDFSFPFIGPLHRTVDSITDAASKLNLDSDKMNAALFWFWNGNPITDEAAFDALKDGDVETAYHIWDKLTLETTDDGKKFWKNISEKNCSAFHNSSVLSLLTNKGSFVGSVVANIKFIESEYFEKFVRAVVDETYKVSKKDSQIAFLKPIFDTINTSRVAELVNYLNEYNFSAKADFQKIFVQKPIEQIEQAIETAKSKRKTNKANAAKAGQELYSSTATALVQIKNTVGVNNVKYSSTADKLANEILQCSIDYFNDSQENESTADYSDIAMDLARKAETIAVGTLAKERIEDSISTLTEMKDRELSEAIAVLQSIKEAYETNEAKVRQHIKDLEQNDYEIRLGYKTINNRVVEENIRNSIDWQKVNELLVELLKDNNLKKIKASDNSEAKIEFIELATWIKEKSTKSSSITTILNKYKAIPPKLPFKILSSEVTNTDNKPLYTKYIRYVGIKLNVQVNAKKSVTFLVRYINPDGSINRSSKNSPRGYTLSTSQNLNTYTTSINLSGWGNSDKCTYEIGEQRIEVYVDEYLVHSKTFSVDLAPSEKLENELKKAEDKLLEIKNTQYFKSDLDTLKSQMEKIKNWQFLRSQSDKERQINEQQEKINNLVKRADTEKSSQMSKQQSIVNEIKTKLSKAEY